MSKLGLGLDDIPSSDKEENPQENRRKSIQRCISSLVHACQCRNANCRMNACHKMKRVVSHTMSCKKKTNNGCPICKQLIALCCYHAKHCMETKCPVPFCPQLKQKLKQKQLLSTLHQAQMLRRRVAIMTGNTGHSTTTPSTPVLDSSPQSSGSQSSINNSSGGKAPGAPPPPGALRAAQEAQCQAEAQRTAPAFGKGKPAMQPAIRPAAPVVPTAGKPVRQPQQQQWPPSYTQSQSQQQRPSMVQNPRMPGMQPHPQPPQPQPSGQPMASGGTAAPGPPGGVGSTNTIGPAVHTMLRAFKNQQLSQNEWLDLLRKNPQLMAQVLKLKNEKIRVQQQQAAQAAQQQHNNPAQQQLQQPLHNMTNMGQSMPQQAGQMQQQQQPNQQMRQMNQLMQQPYRHQHLQQQQTSNLNQFAQPQQPFVQRPRMNFPQQFQNDNSHGMHQFQQQQHMMQHRQPMSPQFMLGQQQANPSSQQMLNQVCSPPASAAGLPQTVRSPQPTPSPRQQPIPSPRHQQSPHHNLVNSQSPLHGMGVGQDTSQLNNDHVMLSSFQTHNAMSQLQNSDVSMGQQDNEVAPLTPQDKLANFVKNM